MRTPAEVGATSPASFRLGELEIDVELGRLTHADGSVVRLEPKTLELLRVLAESAPRPVPRAALKSRIWNGDHIAPGALKHLVWQLRRDLRDEASAPRYVETVRGRGYRLLVDPSANPQEGAARWHRGWLPLGALALVALVLVIVLRWTGEPPLVTLEPLARPVTSLPGNELGAALSAEGSFVVFSWDGGEAGGDYDLFRIPTSGGAPELVTGGPSDELEPALSPGDRRLAFLRGDVASGGRELWVREVESGREAHLATTDGRLLDVAWLSAEELVVVERAEDGASSRLRALSLDGAARELTNPPPPTSDLFPALSPDAQRLAFYRRTRAGAGKIHLVDLRSGELRALETPTGRVAGLAFEASGDSLIVSSDRVPPRGLWSISLRDARARWLGLPGSFVTDPSSGPSGSLVYQDQLCDSNVWALYLDASGGSSRSAVAESMASTRQDMHPTLSPGGDRLALISNRSGENQIWISNWPEGTPQRLPTDGLSVGSIDWSPDGEAIAFGALSKGGVAAVYVVDIVGGSPRVVSRPGLQSVTPRWSRDGASLYYAVWSEDDWWIERRDVGSDEWRILARGMAAQEDVDASSLWILDAHGGGLVRRPAAGDREPVALGVTVADAESWRVTSDGVVYLQWTRDGRREVRRWSHSSGASETLAELEANLPYPAGLSVSPDGRTIFWTRIDRVASDLMFVPRVP